MGIFIIKFFKDILNLYRLIRWKEDNKELNKEKKKIFLDY